MKMKKRIAVFLLLVLMLVSAGCGNTPAQAQSTPAQTQTPAPTAQCAVSVELNDGFVLIPARRFLMGSPEMENWCIKAGLDIWRFDSGEWRNRQVI